MRRVPVLAINFKAYDTAIGRSALNIGRAAERVYKEFLGSVQVIVAPPFTELRTLAESLEIPVFAQHADPVEPGARTGSIPPEAIKEAGARGFLANHSERKLRLDEILFLTRRARALGLATLVCASEPEEAAAISVLDPDMIAVEPPELIGTGIAVSRAKPEVVTRSVSLIRKYNEKVTILTGAGISSAEDAEAAVLLGTSGVLVSSAVMKSKEPERVINSMARAMVRAIERLGPSLGSS
ncbi:MAG: triose-phosphate isomerase [Desulfurococcaceae archaeon]|jgi:triosephosphate isomerase|nr:triose-phosphate isomerase [Desulfurococcaceae archaeon]